MTVYNGIYVAGLWRVTEGIFPIQPISESECLSVDALLRKVEFLAWAVGESDNKLSEYPLNIKKENLTKHNLTAMRNEARVYTMAQTQTSDSKKFEISVWCRPESTQETPVDPHPFSRDADHLDYFTDDDDLAEDVLGVWGDSVAGLVSRGVKGRVLA